MVESDFGWMANLVLDIAFLLLLCLISSIGRPPSYRRLLLAERVAVGLAIIAIVPALLGNVVLDQRVELNLPVQFGAFAFSILVRKLRETKSEYSEVISSLASANSEAGAA